MKRLLLLFIFMVGFLLVPLTVIYATNVVTKQMFGADVIQAYFTSLASLAAAVIPITEMLKKLLKSSGVWTQYLSWLVAAGLSFFGWWLNLGMLEGLSVLWVVIYGIAAGLISNGVFDVGIIQAVLSVFKNRESLK